MRKLEFAHATLLSPFLRIGYITKCMVRKMKSSLKTINLRSVIKFCLCDNPKNRAVEFESFAKLLSGFDTYFFIIKHISV